MRVLQAPDRRRPKQLIQPEIVLLHLVEITSATIALCIGDGNRMSLNLDDPIFLVKTFSQKFLKNFFPLASSMRRGDAQNQPCTWRAAINFRSRTLLRRI